MSINLGPVCPGFAPEPEFSAKVCEDGLASLLMVTGAGGAIAVSVWLRSDCRKCHLARFMPHVPHCLARLPPKVILLRCAGVPCQRCAE